MSKLTEFFKKSYNFVHYGIWQITEHELSRSKWWLVKLGRVIILAIKGYIHDGLNRRASALTYSILFALVPVVALLIAISRGFGVEAMLESTLQESFAAQAELVPTIMDFVTRYLETAQGGVFIGIGLAILLYSVMNFFTQVESIFNDIWHVKKSRSFVNRFSMYFSAVFLIPILVVFSSGLSIYISAILTQSPLYEFFSPFYRFLVKFAPVFVNWVIFTLIYSLIPNTKVKFVNSLIAGIIAGSAFQLFQVLYINGQVYLSRYDVVYGSFAAIPLLLLWLQISCLIVLLGAEISYAAQNIRTFEYENSAKNISHRYNNFLMLFIVHRIVKHFEEGLPPLSAARISEEYLLPICLTNNILDRLTDSRVIIEVFNDDERNKTYQPARDINSITINWVFEQCENFGSSDFLQNKNANLYDFGKKFDVITKQNSCEKYNILVKDI